jgi:hypothetical protein
VRACESSATHQDTRRLSPAPYRHRQERGQLAACNILECRRRPMTGCPSWGVQDRRVDKEVTVLNRLCSSGGAGGQPFPMCVHRHHLRMVLGRNGRRRVVPPRVHPRCLQSATHTSRRTAPSFDLTEFGNCRMRECRKAIAQSRINLWQAGKRRGASRKVRRISAGCGLDRTNTLLNPRSAGGSGVAGGWWRPIMFNGPYGTKWILRDDWILRDVGAEGAELGRRSDAPCPPQICARPARLRRDMHDSLARPAGTPLQFGLRSPVKAVGLPIPSRLVRIGSASPV